ncbi:MAG: flagellar M-ring protein FliF [Firmicutes bacterium]|nr:flagellar M-ring protein FliF [Bacillota bacterium]
MDVTKLKAIWTKIKEAIKKLNTKAKRLIIAGIVLLLIGSAGLAFYLNSRPYVVLFQEVNETEATQIVTVLNDAGVNYKYRAGGTILVPEGQADRLRAQLVMAGYPKSGFSYDTYTNNISMMTTDADRKNYEKFYLQDRIAATIREFDGVKDVNVNIVFPEEQKYVIGNKPSIEASAAVRVTMKDGTSPTVAQVEGIQRLVETSVSQIKFENIRVIDGNGNDVTISDTSGDRSLSAQLKMDVERAIENNIKNKVLDVLKPVYGEENVKVSVKATVDIDKRIREIINYSAPPNEEDKVGIPGNVSIDQELQRPDGEAVGGIPGTETNAEIPIYGVRDLETTGTENYIRNQQDINYLVDQIKEQVQMDTGNLEDLSVSVVINGTDFGDFSRNALRDIIARAAGISDLDKNAKIALESATFFMDTTQVSDTTGQFSRWILIGIIAAAILILLLILLVFLLRRRKKKAKSAALAEVQLTETVVVPPADAVEESEDDKASKELLRIQNEKSMELKENIRKFAEDNPEISAQLIKSWLRGGEDNV